jgi:hypothetical protein
MRNQDGRKNLRLLMNDIDYLMMQTFDDDIDCLMILVKIFTNGLNPVLQ